MSMQLTEFDKQNPPPGGFSPTVAWQLCPPGGAYFTVVLASISTLTHSMQVWTLANDGQFVFATICFLVVATACALIVVIANSKGRSLNFLAWAHEAVCRGVSSPLGILIMMKGAVEGPGLGFLSLYAMTLNPHLTFVGAGNACLSLLLSAKDSGSMLLLEAACTIQDKQDENFETILAVKALAPVFSFSVWLWLVFGSLSEFIFFAVVSRVLHPSITICMYSLCFAGLAIHYDGTSKFCLMFLLKLFSPLNMITGNRPALTMLALAFEPGAVQPARWFLLSTLARLVILSMGMFMLDLPNGMFPISTLGRPMGMPVFEAEFLQPTRCFLHALGSDDVTKYWSSNNIQGDMTIMSGMFRTFVTILFSLTPIYFSGTVFQLLFRKKFADGIEDRVWQSRVNALRVEIHKWSLRRQAASKAEDVPVPLLA